MNVHKILFFLISIILISISNQKELNTFSNYDIIFQTNINVHFIVDFDNKKVDGEVTISFKALDDGEVIILDTKSLIIKNVKDSTGNALDFKLDNYYRLESHGVPLKIYKEYSKDDTFDITIEYSTTKDCMAIDWLEPEQTSGGKYPFMYSQCQSILCREMLPIQDTPAVKMPVTISITVPEELIGLAAGLFVEEMSNGNNKTFTYALDIPIPSYLIAIAAGDIGSQNVSERCTIYAEKNVVEKAAWEFSDTEKFLKIAENYIGEYVWGQYNILVLPFT
jgi:leukotriene-A4 hydrolase